MRRSSLRARLVVTVVGLVGCLMLLATSGTYLLARGQLIESVDRELYRRIEPFTGVLGAPIRPRPEWPAPRFGEAGGTLTLVDSQGNVASESEVPLDGLRKVAERGGIVTRSDRIRGEPVRILAIGRNGAAVQITRSIASTNAALDRLAVGLVLIAIAVVVAAIALAWLLTRPLLAPLRRLERTVDRVRRSGDLQERIDAPGDDEVSRLSRGFNDMLEELQASQERQSRFIADASHELRTPATIIGGNLQLLREGGLDQPDADDIVADLCAEADELARLLESLLDYERDEPRAHIDLADTVRRVAERYDAHERTIVLRLSPAFVEAAPSRAERAIDNLVRNALAWATSTVTVSVGPGYLVVDDDGPGIPDEERLAVFERFHRGERARSRPGNGLGLSIVLAAVEEMDGSIVAERSSDGGCRMRMTFPVPTGDRQDIAASPSPSAMIDA